MLFIVTIGLGAAASAPALGAPKKIGTGYVQVGDEAPPGDSFARVRRSDLPLDANLLNGANRAVPIPTSAWFASFLENNGPGNDGNQGVLTPWPWVVGHTNGNRLFFGLPQFQVVASANGHYPALNGNNQADLALQTQTIPAEQKVLLQGWSAISSTWVLREDASHYLSAIFTEGSPYIYCEANEPASQYPLQLIGGWAGGSGSSAASTDISSRVGLDGLGAWLIYNVAHAYLLVVPLTGPSKADVQPAKFSASNLDISFAANKPGYFVFAALPFKTAGSLTAGQLDFVKLMAELAFNYVSNTWVSVAYTPAHAQVATRFHVQTRNPVDLPEGHGAETLLALLPHHYVVASTANGKDRLGRKIVSGATVVSESGAGGWSARGDGWKVSDWTASVETPWEPKASNPYLLYGNESVFYYSVLGPMLVTEGTGFTVTRLVPGLLPWLPWPSDPSNQHDLQTELLFRFVEDGGISLTQFLQGTFGGTSPHAYNDGKLISEWSDAALAVSQSGLTDNAHFKVNDANSDSVSLAQAASDALARYFAASPSSHWPGSKPRYFDYYEDMQTLLAFPEGYDLTTLFNDHNLTYGYFTNAADTLASYAGFGSALNSTWREPDQYGTLIDQLVYDTLNPYTEDAFFTPTPGSASQYQCSGTCVGLTNPRFVQDNRRLGTKKDVPSLPYLRNYDIYAGHGWAMGIGHIGGSAPTRSRPARTSTTLGGRFSARRLRATRR